MGPVLADVLLTAARNALRREAQRRITLAFRRRAYTKMAEAIGRRAVASQKSVRAAEKMSVDFALEVARELSSGPYKTAQLAAMGHPYRHGGRPPQDPAIINLQTGEFYRGWRVIGPRVSGNDLATKLINQSRHARDLERGTSRMIARPILIRIRERVNPRRRALYKAALRLALR